MSERKTRRPAAPPPQVETSGFEDKPLDVVIVTDKDHEKGPAE